MNAERPMAYPPGPLGAAMQAARAKDWQAALETINPMLGFIRSGNGAGLDLYTPKDLVSCARVAAAAQEQMGLYQEAAETWRALFRKASDALAEWPVTLMDRLNLVRVLARDGALDEATRRDFAGALIHLVRKAGMPLDDYRRLTAILRRQVGLHFETVEDYPAAMEAYGKALRMARRNPELFVPMKGDVDAMFKRFARCAEAMGATTWRNDPIDAYSSARW